MCFPGSQRADPAGQPLHIHRNLAVHSRSVAQTAVGSLPPTLHTLAGGQSTTKVLARNNCLRQRGGGSSKDTLGKHRLSLNAQIQSSILIADKKRSDLIVAVGHRNGVGQERRLADTRHVVGSRLIDIAQRGRRHRQHGDRRCGIEVSAVAEPPQPTIAPTFQGAIHHHCTGSGQPSVQRSNPAAQSAYRDRRRVDKHRIAEGAVPTVSPANNPPSRVDNTKISAFHNFISSSSNRPDPEKFAVVAIFDRIGPQGTGGRRPIAQLPVVVAPPTENPAIVANGTGRIAGHRDLHHLGQHSPPRDRDRDRRTPVSSESIAVGPIKSTPPATDRAVLHAHTGVVIIGLDLDGTADNPCHRDRCRAGRGAVA